MKISINLASQPFRRDRPILVGSAIVAFLLAGTLGVLISLFVMDRSQSADVRLDLARLDVAIRQTQQQQAALEAVLRKPENAEVLERSGSRKSNACQRPDHDYPPVREQRQQGDARYDGGSDEPRRCHRASEGARIVAAV